MERVGKNGGSGVTAVKSRVDGHLESIRWKFGGILIAGCWSSERHIGCAVFLRWSDKWTRDT